MDFHKNILPVQITPAAVTEIQTIFNTKNIPHGYGLRVGVKGTGCSGTGYVLGFDKPGIQDNQYRFEDIPVYIEKKHLLYVAGLIIDFENSDEVRGFTFTMPS